VPRSVPRAKEAAVYVQLVLTLYKISGGGREGKWHVKCILPDREARPTKTFTRPALESVAERGETMHPTTPAVLHTPGFAQSNIAWSPFHTTISSSANYGIIGNDRLYVASTFSGPPIMTSIKLDKV
jgi:hypothetical protein